MQKLPDIQKNFPEWYQEVVYQAELSDNAPVRGCMVVRPYGWAIWENIRDYLDLRIKATGHENAAFPLLIPESFIKREAEHVKGFAPELAVVTHAGGKELEEPLVVRPTSETIFYFMFSKWIKSYRDLPLKLNQWASVVRWEMRPRPFIRSTEFFWQEGHTAHATFEEAQTEALLMLNEYVTLAQDYLAIPVLVGEKSASEKFAGAEKTYTFEGIMPDGKALQMGTSHMLSQSFAKAFEVKFQDQNGQMAYPYFTSWGATTRLVGALIMVHGDQNGLVLPPKVAPFQVVIVPILRGDLTEKNNIILAAQNLADQLKLAGVRVKLDLDEHKTPGAKFYKWELKGVPLRIELGPKDLAANQVIITDRLDSQKTTLAWPEIVAHVTSKLEFLQTEMFKRAEIKFKQNLATGIKLAEFGQELAGTGGAYQTGWCSSPDCEAQLKNYKASIRCVLAEKTQANCFNCAEFSKSDVIVAKSY